MYSNIIAKIIRKSIGAFRITGNLIFAWITYHFGGELFEISHYLPHGVGVVFIEAHLDHFTSSEMWNCPPNTFNFREIMFLTNHTSTVLFCLYLYSIHLFEIHFKSLTSLLNSSFACIYAYSTASRRAYNSPIWHSLRSGTCVRVYYFNTKKWFVFINIYFIFRAPQPCNGAQHSVLKVARTNVGSAVRFLQSASYLLKLADGSAVFYRRFAALAADCRRPPRAHSPLPPSHCRVTLIFSVCVKRCRCV